MLAGIGRRSLLFPGVDTRQCSSFGDVKKQHCEQLMRNDPLGGISLPLGLRERPSDQGISNIRVIGRGHDFTRGGNRV